jgi:hypothetical protein
MALCLTILGVYYILKDHDLNSIGNLEWLPLTILSAYSVSKFKNLNSFAQLIFGSRLRGQKIKI